MLASISGRLIALSRGWLVLVALAVFVLFMALVLPAQAALAEERTGGGAQPDSSFLYAPADLYRMAQEFGPGGRQAYVRARFTFDLVWPLAYTFFLAAAIGWLAGRAFVPGSAWRRLNLLPLLGLAFDYLENITASLVIARYPAQTAVVDLLPSLFTPLKWLFVGGSFVALLAVATAALWRSARRAASPYR